VKKILLKETKIGEFLTIGAEVEGDEVGIFIDKHPKERLKKKADK